MRIIPVFIFLNLMPLTCFAENPYSSAWAYREEGRERGRTTGGGSHRFNEEHYNQHGDNRYGDHRYGEGSMYHREEGEFRRPQEGGFNRYNEGHYGGYGVGTYGNYSTPQSIQYYTPQPQQGQNQQSGGTLQNLEEWQQYRQ